MNSTTHSNNMLTNNMLLAIDVGNTNTVLGFLDLDLIQNRIKSGAKDGVQQGILHTWRVSTHPLCTADEFKIKIDAILGSKHVQINQVTAIVVSSVVPAFTRMIQTSFRDLPLFIINSSWPFSFKIKANPPDQVGADRLVNAEAAVREYGFPSIVVDSGTATTLCAISKNKNGVAEYCGGAIIPGIELSMEALAKNTAQLFTIDLIPPDHAIGANTKDALKSGLMLGYASMIDGMIDRFKAELGDENLPVVATGGISQLMKGITAKLTDFDTDLTLKGIYYLYDAFCKK